MTSTETAAVLGRLPRRRLRLPLSVAGAALSGAVVLFALRSAPAESRSTAAVLYGLIVATPIAVGIVALRLQPDDRFPQLLLAVGAWFSLTALSMSSDSALYSIGRTSVWLVEPALIYLLLAFPSGRLTRRTDRRLIGAVIALVALLYLPTVLFAEEFPQPSPWSDCVGCPPNALAVVHANMAVTDHVIRPIRESLTVVALGGVTASLAQRMRESGTLLRHALAPVLVVAVVQTVAYAIYLWERRNGAVPEAVKLLGQIYLLSLPLVALGFAAGLLNRRLRAAAVLERLTLGLRAPATAGEFRSRLADALEDPTLRIVYWLPGAPGRWVDQTGWPVRAPDARPTRRITELRLDGRLIAAVLHDGALAQDGGLVRAAAIYGLVVLENTRLIEERDESMRQVTETEERSATVAEDERKRIERDVHDGAQQQLLAVRINLGMFSEQLSADAASELDRIAQQIDHTVEELRSLSRGGYPALLAEQGLTAALEVAAREAPLEANVMSSTLTRYSPQIENAVYFSCLEALQNVIKHARSASLVTIALSANGQLRFMVSDDGPGFAQQSAAAGSGLANIAARLAAVGGSLRVDSAPGRGTTIVGTIPIA